MQLRFRIHYHTEWGEQLFISGNIPELGNEDISQAICMDHVSDGHWQLTLDLESTLVQSMNYKYFIRKEGRDLPQWEFGEFRILDLTTVDKKQIELIDSWRPEGSSENAFYTSAFSDVLMKRTDQKSFRTSNSSSPTHRFQVYAPHIPPKHKLCIIGDHPALGNWDEKYARILEDTGFPIWKVDIALKGKQPQIHYKYAFYDEKEKKIIQYESGEDRVLDIEQKEEKSNFIIKTDIQLKPSLGFWKGAGVAIPIFSLRNDEGWGVGEFLDLKDLVDWNNKTGLSVIQILPVNDSIATHSWQDSYPYAAISVFALHPIYLRVEEIGKLRSKKDMAAFRKEAIELNKSDDLDYPAVMDLKSRYLSRIYRQEKAKTFKDSNFLAFVKENEDWLTPYAVFSYMRDKEGTADFNEWKQFSTYDSDEVTTFAHPDHEQYEDIAIHYFIQYHLHLQLLEASMYARERGVVLKGDIPIGIYRHSVDAWVAPHLYNMDAQAGAPPDAFATEGQNWRFPTYNWEVMAQDEYAWWRERMMHMATYFDAYRIDHILGFFRIWEIPAHAVQGLLGQFNPCIPMSHSELAERGIWVDEDRYCLPYIRSHMLYSFFGSDTDRVKQEFLEESGQDFFRFKSHCKTQRQIESYLNEKTTTIPEHASFYERVESGLYNLLSEVLLLRVPSENGTVSYSPRIAMHQTWSFRELDPHLQHRLDQAYIHYFYHRHEIFWKEQAMIKLPMIKAATEMLVCGEDLGMVPETVPSVMKQLDICSLEIQRMPKNPGKQFAHPNDAPFLSVISTSTHDMPPTRSWWEKDHELTREFFREMLDRHDNPPFYCEPWICEEIIKQHLHSPALLAVFPIQDLLAIDGDIKRENPHEEQINDPSNPHNQWKYRLHINISDLNTQSRFNAKFKQMLIEARRTI